MGKSWSRGLHFNCLPFVENMIPFSKIAPDNSHLFVKKHTIKMSKAAEMTPSCSLTEPITRRLKLGLY